jgi:hypothetical protein
MGTYTPDFPSELRQLGSVLQPMFAQHYPIFGGDRPIYLPSLTQGVKESYPIGASLAVR